MSKEKIALYEQVARAIVEKLEQGTSPWQKPWINGKDTAFSLPYNPTTGKNYKGMNSIWLMMQDRQDPRWMTFKQAQAHNWQVRKGEKASTINFIKLHDVRTVRDEKGKPILDENGKPKKKTVRLINPIITTAWVFNAEQIDGLPPLSQVQQEKLDSQKWTNVERAEYIIKATNANIQHGGNQAYYSPGTDHIQMPNKEQFKSASGYYGTMLHELGHWTGQKDRLNRNLTGRSGGEDYAKEELIAEIASYMVRGEIGLEKEFDQTAAYVKSWISVLKNDPYEIFRAASSAQKVFDYILDFENQRDLKKDESIKPEPKKPSSQPFEVSEEISYKDETYRILEVLSAKEIHLKIVESGALLKVKSTDGLFGSLITAKQNAKEQSRMPSEIPETAINATNQIFKR